MNVVAAEIILDKHCSVPGRFRDLETGHDSHIVLVKEFLIIGHIVFLHPIEIVLLALHHLVDVV